MISVIIPTYKTPEALDLCLRSAIKGQKEVNEINVIVDGTYEINKNVLSKHIKNIRPIVLSNNVGMSIAQNIGVSKSKHDNILIVNDDNVFPDQWDTELIKHDCKNKVITPNQIEPYPSIFNQFIIKDLGRDPKTFDLQAFWIYEKKQKHNVINHQGSTYPIYMKRLQYLACGGFDIEYPTKTGTYTDWDFFLKCELNRLIMERIYSIHFYHFVSVTRKNDEDLIREKNIENECYKWFINKWGKKPNHNPLNNSKIFN